jgi:hypothetical protein
MESRQNGEPSKYVFPHPWIEMELVGGPYDGFQFFNMHWDLLVLPPDKNWGTSQTHSYSPSDCRTREGRGVYHYIGSVP